MKISAWATEKMNKFENTPEFMIESILLELGEIQYKLETLADNLHMKVKNENLSMGSK